jgi:hypothetical protein
MLGMQVVREGWEVDGVAGDEAGLKREAAARAASVARRRRQSEKYPQIGQTAAFAVLWGEPSKEGAPLSQKQ